MNYNHQYYQFEKRLSISLIRFSFVQRPQILCYYYSIIISCPPLGFGQINSDSLNWVPFIKSLNRQMLMNHDQGIEPVTMSLVCLRPSNIVSDSIVALFWLIEHLATVYTAFRNYPCGEEPYEGSNDCFTQDVRHN